MKITFPKILKWLEINWFKIALTLSILLCATSVFHYTSEQQRNRKQSELNNFISNCQKQALEEKVKLSSNGGGKGFTVGNLYEYNYNPIYQACIVAYKGSYFSVDSPKLVDMLGHNLFEIKNLSNGQILFSARVNFGDAYREASDKFENLRNQYIGSTLPIEVTVLTFVRQ